MKGYSIQGVRPFANGVYKYVWSVIVILMITGISKLLEISFNSGRILEIMDPILSIKFKHLLLLAGVAEISVSVYCVLSVLKNRIAKALAWIVILSSNIAAYRMALWVMDWQRPCNCLGNLTDALHIPPQTADTAMKIILAYLLIGSYGILFHQLWKNRKLKACKSELLSQSSETGAGS